MNGLGVFGTRCADAGLTVAVCRATADLPPDAIGLMDGAGTLFGSLPWWEVSARYALPPGVEPAFVLVSRSNRVLAVFPLRIAGAADSFTTPYSCLYAPALAADVSDADKLAVFAAFGRYCRRWGVVRLDAMDRDWPEWPWFHRGIAAAGLVVRPFDHFGNWYARVAGLNWVGYLATRPGALRETVRRRLKRAEAMPDARFTLYAHADTIEAGIAAFEAVYARSWKEPEPFPDFNAALIRAASAAGWARLGVWQIADQPVAVQFWVVLAGQATVLKLAHDEAFKAHSPGTVLTAMMLRWLLTHEDITEIDFGRGDDPYKQGWTGHRRQRIGVLLINPIRLTGAIALARHSFGRLARRLGLGRGLATAAQPGETGQARAQ